MTMKVPVGFALFLAAGVAHALDPQRAPSQYVLAKWDSSSGLPSSGINAMCQTRDHYLWLGTSVGLARFDGARFVVFNARNTPDFGDGVVSSLSAGADGTLSVGASSAVMRYRDGVFARLPIPTGTGAPSCWTCAGDGKPRMTRPKSRQRWRRS